MIKPYNVSLHDIGHKYIRGSFTDHIIMVNVKKVSHILFITLSLAIIFFSAHGSGLKIHTPNHFSIPE